MRVHWTDRASNDLFYIGLYISGDNPRASDSVVRTIFDSCEGLVVAPHRGRIGKKRGTRELLFAPLPYIAVYRVTGSVIEILAIWHGAQNR
jgi:plasmid stabilization system protein ParE